METVQGGADAMRKSEVLGQGQVLPWDRVTLCLVGFLLHGEDPGHLVVIQWVSASLPALGPDVLQSSGQGICRMSKGAKCIMCRLGRRLAFVAVLGVVEQSG